MSRKPAAPANLRNGMKWRDGRPRWEPSPANRKIGLKGCNLKDGDRWLERGDAIASADARALWADLIREAVQGGPAGQQAASDLRRALGALDKPQDGQQALRRALVQDLIDKAAAILADEDLAAGLVGLPGRAPRTVDAMIDGYLADAKLEITESTRDAYRTQSKKIRAKFGPRRVDSLTTGQLREWYAGDGGLKATYSLSTANQTMGALGAMLQWAVYKDWLAVSPSHRLNLQAAPGRRVFWTVEEERTFTSWCDANGYPDIADGVILMLWTAARPIDACLADLEVLAGDTWRYVPIKTRKRQREALAGLMPQVQARIERRRGQTLSNLGRGFLVDPTNGRRHTSDSFGERGRLAINLAVAAGDVPATLTQKQFRDCRDTCITRLFESDITLTKICMWTAHSQKDAEDVLRDHYLVLREEGARESLAKLQGWADLNGVVL